MAQRGCYIETWRWQHNTQHGERDPASAGSCQSWPHHVGCCPQVFASAKIPDVLNMHIAHTWPFFQAEYCSRLSSDPGVRGRQGLCRGRKYWQSRPPFRLLREGVITSWWSLEGSTLRCGGYRMWKMRTVEGSRTKSEQHLIVTNTDESL